MWGVVALCALIAIWDPAARLKRRIRSHRRAPHAIGRGKPGSHAQAQGDAGHTTAVQVRGEGAAPAVVAPSPAGRLSTSYAVEVLYDGEIWMSDQVVLGHILRKASRAPAVTA